MKVSLTQRISNLEEKVAAQIRTGHLEGRPVYQPGEEELTEAMAILVNCGAVREDRVRLPGKAFH